MQEEIRPLLDGLLYPSESDEPVHYLSVPRQSECAALTPGELAAHFQIPDGVEIREREPAQFWKPVTEFKSWYGDFENERTRRFMHLKSTLEHYLDGIRYFEVGEIEVQLFLIGTFGERLAGLTTTAIRT